MSLELVPVFESPGLQLGPVFDVGGPPAFVSVSPTASGATVSYSGAVTHYRINGGAAVAVPSNPFTFSGLAANTEPHTVELSGDGGSSWPVSWTFGTLNPGTGTGDIPTPTLVDVAIAAPVLLRVTPAVQAQAAPAPPPAGAVDVAIAAPVLLRVTPSVDLSVSAPAVVGVVVDVPVLLRVTPAVQMYWGEALPPLTRSSMRTVPAGRKTPQHLQPLDAAEVDDLAFDFAAKLPAGDSVAAATLTVEARVGTDEAAAPLKVGLHQVQGALVLQRLSGALGVPGVTYLLRCEAQLASGKKLLAAAFLKVTRQA